MRNRVELIGRLGADPEVKQTTSGKTVCRLSVATSERWTDREGQKQEKTEWHRAVLWGKSAENAGKFLSKGSLVHIEGKNTTRSYEKDSQKFYVTEIMVKAWLKLDRSSDSGGSTEQEPSFEASFDNNEEIPF